MAEAVPEVLRALLGPSGSSPPEDRWAEFVRAYSKLLFHVTRSVGGDSESAMDRYAFVLEQLRRDEYHRLRAYVADGRSEFSTWLVVVAQRLCLDHRRQRYGRSRPSTQDSQAHDEDRAARRRLVDLIGAEVDLSALADPLGVDAEDAVRQADLHEALQSALSRLHHRDRLLIRLRFEDDLPMPEVAQALGLPTRFHAYRRLTEVLALLRRELERGGVRGSEP